MVAYLMYVICQSGEDGEMAERGEWKELAVEGEIERWIFRYCENRDKENEMVMQIIETKTEI